MILTIVRSYYATLFRIKNEWGMGRWDEQIHLNMYLVRKLFYPCFRIYFERIEWDECNEDRFENILAFECTCSLTTTSSLLFDWATDSVDDFVFFCPIPWYIMGQMSSTLCWMCCLWWCLKQSCANISNEVHSINVGYFIWAFTRAPKPAIAASRVPVYVRVKLPIQVNHF